MSPRRKKGNSNSVFWQWTKHPRTKQMFKICRWIHVYLSTVLFSLFLFFCVTGLFLNHTQWFKSDQSTSVSQIELPENLAAIAKEDQENARKQLESFIENRFGLFKPRQITLDREFNEWRFDYPLPAGYAYIIVENESGLIELEHQEGSLVSLLNDLHKGRHTGTAWSWVIDISAILLSLMALSGLFILFQQAKWRVHGVLFIIIGTIIPWLIYWLWVPQVS